jgi:hypothetical protein
MNQDEQEHIKFEMRIRKLEEQNERILRLLEPISNTYKTANTVGKWIMGILVFFSVLIGLIVGIKNL